MIELAEQAIGIWLALAGVGLAAGAGVMMPEVSDVIAGRNIALPTVLLLLGATLALCGVTL